MGMSIDDSIRELMWVRKVNEKILKTDAKEIDIDSAWIKHWENVVKSLDVAVETIRKYQQIEQIVDAYITDNPREPMYDTEDYMQSIREVLEDGRD